MLCNIYMKIVLSFLNEKMYCSNTSLMSFIMFICFIINMYITNINEDAKYLATLKDFNNGLGL